MKKTINLQALLCIALVSMFVYACKKDVKESLVTPAKPSNTGSALGTPIEFDEEDLSDFIGEVIYYHNHPLDDNSVPSTDYVDLMEAGINYVHSDMDTGFADYDTTLYYTFSLPINMNDEYNMQDIQEEMYNIKAIIKGREDDYIGGGVVPRFMTCCIDQGGSGNEYVVTLLFGQAYETPPSFSDEPTANTVPNGSYVWETLNHGHGCTENTAPSIQVQGEAYFLALQNFYIHTTLYWPPGQQPYINGNAPITRTRMMNGISQPVKFVAWDDVSVSTTGFPTSMLTNPRPNASAMFVKSTDPTYVLGGSLPVVEYFTYCMNQDYVNWYIAKYQTYFLMCVHQSSISHLEALAL